MTRFITAVTGRSGPSKIGACELVFNDGKMHWVTDNIGIVSATGSTSRIKGATSLDFSEFRIGHSIAEHLRT